MKQLRRLREVLLQKATKEKQDNGATITSYQAVGTYNVVFQEITDEVFATIYGANITNMLRLASVREELETLLKTKNTDLPDNISLYYIVIGNKRYKVKAVATNWVDIEFYETVREVISA